MLRIVAPHFTAGIEPFEPQNTAPILMWMIKRKWPESEIIGYCARKGWKVEKV